MLEALNKLFGEQLGLSAEIWLYILLAVVVLAFAITLIVGLLTGSLKVIKTVMKTAISNPQTAVGALKKLPAPVKAQYKNARMGNLKPSMLVTESVCVGEPYKHSLISKVWIVTLSATLICAGIAYFAAPLAEGGELAMFVSPLTVLILGGLLTLIGGIVGRCAYDGAVKTYAKFVPVLDGDAVGGAGMAQPQQPVYSEPQATAYAAQAQQAYTAEPQAEYVEPQQAVEPEPVYAAEPQQAVYEAPPVMAQPQESEEAIRARAREEALKNARAAQAEQQAQAAQAQQAYAQAQAAAATSSAEDVIAQIEKIDREGAPRETMREVATLLQKERAKPENKTPEQQKRLNEALSKLLKAMSAASKK